MSDSSLVKTKFVDYTNSVISNEKVSHAYLIEVDNYDSDFNYILNFIKMILLNKKYDEILNCDDKTAYMIDSLNFPDLKIVSSDGTFIKKDQMVDLQYEFNNKSLYGSKRFYIIKECEKLNSSSANTILKFLEEPEDNIFAFLVTDNRFHVLDTILSRCQVLSLKESSFDFFIDNNLLDFLECLLCPNKFFVNYKSLLNDYISDKYFMIDLLHNSENIIISYLNLKNSSTTSNNFNSDLAVLLNSKSEKYLISIISIIEDELPKLRFNVNFKLWLDSLFSKLIGV